MNQTHPPSSSIADTAEPVDLQAIIFDVDGTLAETEKNGHRVAFNRAFTELGIDWHWSPEEYGRLLSVAGGKERIRLFAGTNPPDTDDLDAWVARLYRRKSEIYSEIALSGEILLRPGIRRLIGELRQAGLRLAISTTTAHNSLNSLIKANFGCPMEDLFEVIGAGDQVPNKKPAPDIYNWVLEKMRLPAAACLAIEDTWIGLTAARSAGLASVVTVSNYSAGEDFSGALSIVSNLGEPGDPARHLGGLALSHGYVDLAQLRTWHAAAYPHPR